MKIDLNNILTTSPKMMEQMYKIYEYTIKDNYFLSDNLRKIPLNNQITFLTYPSEEILYGGMAGGGKTEALLMSALQYVEEKHIPQGENKLTYDALIVRRTLDDLEMPNAILDRAKQWLLPLEDAGLVTYQDRKKKFTFSSGATLTFRYLAHNNDLNKYQGAELQFIAFDELTQFPENQYSYLHSRLRKTEENKIPLRMRAGSNPGGMGHDWVKRRFVAEGSQLPFVPSSYLENKYLNHDEYSKQLDKLDPLTRQQLKFGDWDAVIHEGLLIDRERLKKSLISHTLFYNWVPSYCVIGVDSASTGNDKFAMACLVYFDNGILVLVDLDATPSSSPEETLREFIIRNSKWKPRVVNFEREPGSSSHYALDYWRNVLGDLARKYSFFVKDTPAASTGSKYNRARPHANLIKENKLLFNQDISNVFIDGVMYSPLNSLFNQYIYVHPDKEFMKDYSSPDELDSVSYAFSEMQGVIGSLHYDY